MNELRESLQQADLLTEEITAVLDRADKVDAIANEHASFVQMLPAIREQVTFIRASMESIENDGISQSVMSSIQHRLPGIAADIPLNGYTQALSRHNVGYALESLGSGGNALTVGSIAGAIAIVLKVLQWCITTIKAYLKSRREINRVGLGTTSQANKIGNVETPPDVLAALARSREFVNAANGYQWLRSIREEVDAPFTFDSNGLVEWWPELLKEMEYEYRALLAAYEALLTGHPFKPNISSVKNSAAFSRFFKALPQGAKRDGKPCSTQEAMTEFNANPVTALSALGGRLSQMFMVKQITNKEEMVADLLRMGRSIETYTVIDRLVYDSLNNLENNRAFDKLHAEFSSLYKAVQRQKFNADPAAVETFVGYVNIYADKMNAFSRIVTLVSFLDSMSYTSGENLSALVIKWTQLMEDRA